ncbi:HEPN family nuclease [Dysgonomonas sp. PH5-45]|uniref:HEPN family nuclease n=1 Tax=Dysgonomonas sp. PH5-45 TaxID=1742396 RepID=UPI0038B2A62B
MSEYTNFPKDFLVRTKDNLNNYEGDYAVTNLINSYLWLIIIPDELLIKKLPNYQFTDNDNSIYKAYKTETIAETKKPN